MTEERRREIAVGITQRLGYRLVPPEEVQAELLRQAKLLERCRALLQRAEWASDDVSCRFCGEQGGPAGKQGGLHAPDCELAALLREMA